MKFFLTNSTPGEIIFFDVVPLHIWPLMTFTAILKQKIYQFCLYFPEALTSLNMVQNQRSCHNKQLGFYLKSLGTIITKLWSFVLAAKFFAFGE